MPCGSWACPLPKPLAASRLAACAVPGPRTSSDFFGHTEDLTRTAWRGGWTRVRTMEAYLQESALHAVLRSMDEEHRRLIADLAELA